VKDAVLELPFDQYQRYRLVADLLRQLRGEGPQLRVLDVGGRTAVLRDFISDARIDLVDVEPSGSEGLVLGDGARLPFKDGSFDAVCGFDTLEHVPPPLRRAFVSECRRVARRWVILAGPYASERVAESEELLQRFMRGKIGHEHRYLNEHREHGLPDRDAVESQLRDAGGVITTIPHGNLDRWLVLQCLSMYLDYDAALRGVAKDFQRWYNAELYASDHAAPCYRHVVVAAFDGAASPVADRLLAPPQAPAGALAPFTRLTPALLEFDAERSRWAAERKLFEQSVDELHGNVAKHEALQAHLVAEQRRLERDLERVCAELAATQAAHAKTTDELNRDLEGHRHALQLAHDELESLRGLGHHGALLLDEVETLRRAIESERASHAIHVAHVEAALAERERDLEGHRASLAALTADLEGHRQALSNAKQENERQAVAARAELEKLAAEKAELERDLDGHRRSLATVQADLDGHRAALANALRDLDGEHAARDAAEQGLQRADAELRRMLQLANGLEHSLAKRELVYDELRRELRSRWRNLLRVFRPMS